MESSLIILSGQKIHLYQVSNGSEWEENVTMPSGRVLWKICQKEELVTIILTNALVSHRLL